MNESGLPTDPTVRAFGMNVSHQMKLIDARVLDAPQVAYANGKAVTPQNGAWNMRDCKLLLPVNVKSWQLAVFTDGVRPGPPFKPVELMNQLVAGFKRSANLTLPPRTVAPPVVQNPREPLQALLERALAQPVQILLVVLPDDTSGRYADIKKFGDGSRGVVSQCMLAKNLVGRPPRGAPPGAPAAGGPDLQYLANVALKINGKLDGCNSGLFPEPGPARGALPVIGADPGVFIMGADVTHPPPKNGQTAQSVTSVAAVVGSMDAAHTRYAADMVIQSGEICSALDAMCMRLLKMRYKSTGHKPHSILFFRDGVSEVRARVRVRARVHNAGWATHPPPRLPHCTGSIRLGRQPRGAVHLAGAFPKVRSLQVARA